LKICVITGTRAEYGLLRWLMSGIRDSSKLHLQVIATGMHLSPEFGSTYRVIESDGFAIDRKVEMLLSSDTPSSVSKSTGLALIGFSDAFTELKPDMIIVLGDRFELLAAASAALFARIPIIHIHGGETTEGAFDEAIRHSITKMSSMHFVAAEPYRNRVIQLGEQPETVHTVGGLGLDNIEQLDLLDRSALEEELGISLQSPFILTTFHPVTLGDRTSEEQIRELLKALNDFPAGTVVFTMPNSDSDSRVLFERIREYTDARDSASVFTSLGQLRYLSAMLHCDVVVGNSSSGLLEAPAFRKPTVNIGDRQAGRLQAASVIDCKPEHASITGAIHRALSPDFQAGLRSVKHPYGRPGASARILQILENLKSPPRVKKTFFDLPVMNHDE